MIKFWILIIESLCSEEIYAKNFLNYERTFTLKKYSRAICKNHTF